MTRKEEIKRIWSESFNDSPEYVDMYFDRVYNDADGMVLQRGGRTVSSLLLQRYSLMIGPVVTPMGYIAGAATRRNARGNGYMSTLMKEALEESRRRGDMLCALIPAHDWLYFFYDRFDFSTVFYVDRQRFTSRHVFAGPEGYVEARNQFSPEVYDAYAAFERARGGMVLHSHRDFLNILDDMRMDPDARFVVMTHADSGKIASMAWATATPHMVTVRELLGADADARTAALRQLREYYPDIPFTVLAPAKDNSGRHLYARGMGRIVNVERCLQAVAEGHPEWHSVIRVKDRLIPDNSHTYTIRDGKAEITDTSTKKPDLDIPVEVLNRLLFSDPWVGNIVEFPSARPHMSLMLD
ncbi:MAG: GNAT family N-acetyltransferase [Muribaculaceae bacterium]|nr:GNAT family N-acetyltransferase [Muribaculaceae bacterium]